MGYDLVFEFVDPELVHDSLARVRISHAARKNVVDRDLSLQKLSGIRRHFKPRRESRHGIAAEDIRIGFHCLFLGHVQHIARSDEKPLPLLIGINLAYPEDLVLGNSSPSFHLGHGFGSRSFLYEIKEELLNEAYHGACACSPQNFVTRRNRMFRSTGFLIAPCAPISPTRSV